MRTNPSGKHRIHSLYQGNHCAHVSFLLRSAPAFSPTPTTPDLNLITGTSQGALLAQADQSSVKPSLISMEMYEAAYEEEPEEDCKFRSKASSIACDILRF